MFHKYKQNTVSQQKGKLDLDRDCILNTSTFYYSSSQMFKTKFKLQHQLSYYLSQWRKILSLSSKIWIPETESTILKYPHMFSSDHRELVREMVI